MNSENKIATSVAVIEDLNKEDKTVVPFLPKVVTGGKGTGNPNDWLSSLDVGTMFLVKEKNTQDFVLPLFKIAEKTDKSVMLVTSGPNGGAYQLTVEPIRFCMRYTMHETIAYTEVTDEETNE